jgi:putative MATE family efflux protein
MSKEKSTLIIGKGTSKLQIVKTILTLAVPIILSNLLYTVQNIVSILLVAPLGKEAIAGVGFGSTLLWFIYASMATVYTGVNVLVAQNVGAGSNAGRFVNWGVLLSVALAFPMLIFGEEFTRFFLKIFSTPKEVIETSVIYLKPIFTLLPFAFITNSFNAAFNGLGKTKIIFYATVFTTSVNITLALGLIYGYFGFPKLGIEGAGWAVAIAETLALFVYLPFLLKEPKINPLKEFFFKFSDLWRLLKIGVPTGVERLIMSFSYNVFVGLVAVCGTSVLAAFQIGLRIEAFSFTVGMAFAFVATTLVGQNFGAKNPFGIREGTKLTWLVSATLMTLLGILIAIFSKRFALFFSKDPEVVNWTVKYLLIIAVSQPLMATIFVISGALRGLGKTHIPLAINISNFWLVRLLPAMLLLKFYKTPYIPWGTMLLENVTRSTTYILLYRKFLKKL